MSSTPSPGIDRGISFHPEQATMSDERTPFDIWQWEMEGIVLDLVDTVSESNGTRITQRLSPEQLASIGRRPHVLCFL